MARRAAPKAAPSSRFFGIDSGMFTIVARDFNQNLEAFWDGFGRPKSLIFAIFAMFFRCYFSTTVRKGKKSSQEAGQDGSCGILNLDSGHPQAPGERFREGYKDIQA